MNTDNLNMESETLPLLRPYLETELEKIRLLGLSKTVKVFALSDILFNILYSIYFTKFYIFMIIPGYLGYYGSSNFHINFTSIYAIVLLFELLFKLYFIFISINLFYFIYNVFFFSISIYVLGIITKFIRELKSTDIELIIDLQSGWKPRSIPFVYY